MIFRNLTTLLLKSQKSILLLGPRQVGKSTLISSLNPELTVNLADQNEYLRFVSNPNELRERIETTSPKTVFIDEVQRYPELLNTVQALVDSNKKLKFYLTGSSARKLKRGQANLLPGRVLNYYLGPLVASELDYQMDEDSIIGYGTLPEIYLEKKLELKTKILSSYVANYIQEEIKAESLVRNVEAFARAIPYVFRTAGFFVDYSKLAKQAKVSRHSLARFYEIFEDTLIGSRIWPDERLKESADLVKHPKFFLFDVGVYNAVNGSFIVSEIAKGQVFEQLLYSQLTHSAWSKDKRISISSFRTRGGLETDFIVTLEQKRFAIEAKYSKEVSSDDTTALIKVRSYEKGLQPMIAFRGTQSKKINGIWCHPWQLLLKELGL